MPFCVSSACEKAVTLSGTSWRRSLRRVAVTTTSSMPVGLGEFELFVAPVGAGLVSAAAAAEAPATASAHSAVVKAKWFISPPFSRAASSWRGSAI